mmetsp:Transcript_30695/g.5540  ORF Transcript_30695/g.5540 Transcript_30695/m.5540 type:complete len:96 (-) Transcript_30695:688-975(-)
MQHGLLDSSDTFITNDPDIAPGLTLARSGFDVWFGNNRGNKYSIGHTTLKTNSNAFWAFSWQEMAKYDVPAMVGYTLDKTGKEKLSYVGHSEGTV